MLAAVDIQRDFDVEDFLAREQAKDLLRFTTAGSVDDGKSTLIGRLLYDSRNIYEDQLKAVTKASLNRAAGAIDFALLTDGLRAEREQGITIDVAYRFFATANRKFIIADTPGHEEYTRNMATGASTADLAVILVDVRNGVLPQSRRHAYIAALLGIPNFVIAVNKMDLVEYSQDAFRAIEAEFQVFLSRLNVPHAYFLPISALKGDNVVSRSVKMDWFKGPSLLEHLETVPVYDRVGGEAFRFPVQRVERPNHNFRGYSGQIASGSIQPGDSIIAMPSGQRSRVKSIQTFDGPLDQAFAPMSVTLTLEDELDVSRGDMLASAQHVPGVARQFEANVVWLNQEPLDLSRTYLLKQTTQTVTAQVKSLRHRVNMKSLEHEPADRLEMNAIGVVRIETSRPIYFDAYKQNRAAGSLIIIDPATNATVGAGMILAPVRIGRDPRTIEWQQSHVTHAERIARYRHTPASVSLGRRMPLARLVERRLFDRGCAVAVTEDLNAKTFGSLLLLVVSDRRADWDLPSDDELAADQVIAILEKSGVLLQQDELTGGDGI